MAKSSVGFGDWVVDVYDRKVMGYPLGLRRVDGNMCGLDKYRKPRPYWHLGVGPWSVFFGRTTYKPFKPGREARS